MLIVWLLSVLSACRRLCSHFRCRVRSRFCSRVLVQELLFQVLDKLGVAAVFFFESLLGVLLEEKVLLAGFNKSESLWCCGASGFWRSYNVIGYTIGKLLKMFIHADL